MLQTPVTKHIVQSLTKSLNMYVSHCGHTKSYIADLKTVFCNQTQRLMLGTSFNLQHKIDECDIESCTSLYAQLPYTNTSSLLHICFYAPWSKSSGLISYHLVRCMSVLSHLRLCDSWSDNNFFVLHNLTFGRFLISCQLLVEDVQQVTRGLSCCCLTRQRPPLLWNGNKPGKQTGVDQF